MTLTEIKKELYRRKPKATFIRATKAGLQYVVSIRDESPSGQRWENVTFIVPLTEIGDAIFPSSIESQHLIRYIVTPENNTPNDNG